jgi:hypothetical protein
MRTQPWRRAAGAVSMRANNDCTRGTTTMIASGPPRVAKHERINARSAPPQNALAPLRQCSTLIASSAMASSTAASIRSISPAFSAWTGAGRAWRPGSRDGVQSRASVASFGVAAPAAVRSL